MRKLYLIGALSALAFLTGCSSHMFSGEVEETIAVDGNGNAVKGITGSGKVLRNSKARSASIVESGASAAKEAVESVDPLVAACGAMPGDEAFKEMGATAAAEFFRSRGACLSQVATMNMIGLATGNPTSAAGEIMKYTYMSVAQSEQGMTNRLKGFVNPVAMLLGFAQREKTNRETVNAVAQVGQAAAQAGTINIDTIQTNNNASIGANSNDPVSQSAGGNADDGSPALTPGATASTSSSLTYTPETNINLNGTQLRASESGRVNTAGDNLQALEASATANLNDDGRQNGQVTADENSGDLDNDDGDSGTLF